MEYSIGLFIGAVTIVIATILAESYGDCWARSIVIGAIAYLLGRAIIWAIYRIARCE